MSVRKSFRLENYTNALLEEISEYLKKSQTDVLEQLIRDYVVFEIEAVEGKKLMQRASTKIKNQKV